MKRYKIGITDFIPDCVIEEAAFPEADFVLLNGKLDDERVKQCDALLVWHSPINSRVLPSLSECKILVRYGVGVDNVDVKQVKRAGIKFCNTPDYGTEEVADTACAMILCAVRRVFEHDSRIRRTASAWNDPMIPSIRRTRHLSLGIIGVGRIGSAVLRRLKEFGFSLRGYDPYLPEGIEKSLCFERVSDLESLLEKSDIISLHCPLTEQTKGMVNASFLAQMKPGAALVNTARGGLIRDVSEIRKVLASNHLSSVSLDVLPEEPPSEELDLLRDWKENTPWAAGRIIINPHAAFYSREAWHDMRRKCAETARLYLVENVIRNEIRT